jgi:hypothetical protein
MFALSSGLYATTFYVATNGSDGNAGTQSSPFATIQQAVNAAQPGDTVSVADGTYGPNGNYTCGIICSQDNYAAQATITRSGTLTAPITIMAQNKWGAILDGGLQYGYKGDGVLCADGVTACPCQCSDGAFYFGGTVSYITIMNFAITRQFWSGATVNGDQNTNIQFIGNHFYGIGNRYYQVTGQSLGIVGVFAGVKSSSLTFNGNEFNNIGRLPTPGQIVSDDYTHDHGIYLFNGPHSITNNIFYSNTAGWGIQISPGANNTVVANNTFQGRNPQKDGLLMLWATAESPDTNVTIQNNIFYGGGRYAIATFQAYEAGTIVDHNTVYGAAFGVLDMSTVTGTLSLTNNLINTDPLFVNPAAHDFHLLGCSPVIDAGTAEAFASDFDGSPRPLGAGFDIGAYEYNGLGTAPAAAPGSLIASAVSDTAIRLTWTNNAPTATAILIEQSTDNVNFAQVAGVTCHANVVSVTGLSAGTQYYFRLRAQNSVATSDYSNTASVSTFYVPAPSALTATASSSTAINLKWTNNSPTATAIVAESSTDGINFTQLSSLPGNATSFASTGLSTGTAYYYRVRAMNTAGASAYSNTASAVLMPPAAPGPLVASAVSASVIEMHWTNNSPIGTAILIENSTDGLTFSQAAVLGARAASYWNTNLKDSTLYYYRVRAQNAVGFSSYSNTAMAATLPLPAAPSSLIATAVSDSEIDLAWANNAPTASDTQVEASIDNMAFSTVANLPPSVNSWRDTALNAGTRYYYRVRAQDSAGSSVYSNTATDTTFNLPAAPSSLTAAVISGSEIDLAWVNNFLAADAVVVEVSTDGLTFTQIAVLSGSATSYQSTGLTRGAQYFYRVRAQNTSGTSAYSNSVIANTSP